MVNLKAQCEYALLWIETLATTDHKQLKGSLESVDEGFCCLGLGAHTCNVAFDPDDAGAPALFVERVGLRHTLGFATPESGVTYASIEWDTLSLIALNDEKEYSFKQIAAALKKNPQRYFEEEVAGFVKLAYS